MVFAVLGGAITGLEGLPFDDFGISCSSMAMMVMNDLFRLFLKGLIGGWENTGIGKTEAIDSQSHGK